jgi:predicted nucleic acid-binding protein
MSVVLLDTGPLVAFLNRRDDFHEWSKEQLDDVAPPLLTCEAVIAEACYLLRDLPRGSAAVMQMIEREQITNPFRLEDEVSSIRTLLERYASVPMDLADACLVRMSEQYSRPRLLTLDSDFRVYRRHGRQTIPLIIPEPA